MDQGFFCRIRGVDGVPQNCEVAGHRRAAHLMTSWFRLRRAVEHTPTVLLVVELQPHAKTCASLTLEMRREGAGWFGAPGLLAIAARHPGACGPAQACAGDCGII
jgi:hypothetical protein